MNRQLLTGILVAVLFGCASAPNMNQQAMRASFYDMKEDAFSLQAIAPTSVIREYAICKAIWFAEKKRATKLSLGDPIYNNQPRELGKEAVIPEGWAVVDATAYLSEANFTGNPFVNVVEMAASCRSGWNWYN